MGSKTVWVLVFYALVMGAALADEPDPYKRTPAQAKANRAAVEALFPGGKIPFMHDFAEYGFDALGTAIEEALPKTKAANELALKLLDDEDPYMRRIGVKVLSYREHDRLVAKLAELAEKEKDKATRIAAINALGFMEKATSALPELTRVISDPKVDSETAGFAINAVCRIGTDDGVKAIEKVLYSKADDSTKAIAISKLGWMQLPGPTMRMLERVMMDPKQTAEIRANAVGGLASVKEIDEKGVRALAKALLLRGVSREFKKAAVWGLEGAGEQAKFAVPELIQALDFKEDEIKILAATALGKTKDKRAIPALLTLLGKVRGTGDLGPELTSALAGLGADEAEYLPIAAAKMLDLSGKGLASRETSETFEAYRSHLPSEATKTKLDHAVRRLVTEQQLARKDIPDPCDVVCALVEKGPLWTKPQFYKPEFGSDTYSWSFAISSLDALFLSRAAPYCKNADEMREKFTSEMLAKGFKETDEKSAARPPDPATVYGKTFYSLLLRDMLRNPKLSAKDRARMEGELSDVDRSHARDLSRFEIAKNRVPREGEGRTDSLYNTYAFTSSYLALLDPPANARQKMAEIDSMIRSPSNVPYDPGSGNESSRAASARSPQFHLGLYQKETDPIKKRRHRENLIASLENFLLHSPSLQAHVPRNGVHEGIDGLAPYYYYPTVPYATSAVKILLERTEDPEEKKRLESMANQLKLDLLDMLKKDGLFVDQGKPGNEHLPTGYHASPAYVNPLAGLALLPLIEACKGQKVPSSTGIVDMSLEARIIPFEERNRSKTGKSPAPGPGRHGLELGFPRAKALKD